MLPPCQYIPCSDVEQLQQYGLTKSSTIAVAIADGDTVHSLRGDQVFIWFLMHKLNVDILCMINQALNDPCDSENSVISEISYVSP